MFIGDSGDVVVAFSRLRIQPSQARFGRLCVGKSFRYGFRVTNIGYEIGRFHVGPVVIQEGNVSARVVRRAGPIAPGMAVRMELEVYAEQVRQAPLQQHGDADGDNGVAAARSIPWILPGSKRA